MAKQPDEVALKWQRNLTGSVQTIKDGVGAVTVSPTELAAKKKAEWLAGIQKAADSGKWEDNLRSVSLQDWKDKMLTKGVPRISGGAQAATPKVEKFMQQLLPYTEKVKAAVKAMPKLNLQDSIARATKAIEMMSQFKFNRKG